MKHCLKPVYALFAATVILVAPAYAGDEKNMVVSIETDSISLTELDIGSLAVGESKTIETKSGQVIDLLRTVDDVEVYIDGKLLDIGAIHDHGNQVNVIRKHVEIICDDDDDSACDKHMVISTGGDHEISAWSAEGDMEVLIHDDIEINCVDDEDGSDCAKKVILISKDGEVDIEALQEEHVDGEGHKIIVITSEVDSND